jgi:hypothetical protein
MNRLNGLSLGLALFGLSAGSIAHAGEDTFDAVSRDGQIEIEIADGAEQGGGEIGTEDGEGPQASELNQAGIKLPKIRIPSGLVPWLEDAANELGAAIRAAWNVIRGAHKFKDAACEAYIAARFVACAATHFSSDFAYCASLIPGWIAGSSLCK